MKRCWELNPKLRISVEALVHEISLLLPRITENSGIRSVENANADFEASITDGTSTVDAESDNDSEPQRYHVEWIFNPPSSEEMSTFTDDTESDNDSELQSYNVEWIFNPSSSQEMTQ